MDNDLRMALNDWQREQQARALRFGPKPPKVVDPNDPKKRKLPPRQFSAGPRLRMPEMQEYILRFKPVFRRRDTLRNAVVYCCGLCSELERKNGETMEAAIPEANQENLYNFLVRSDWSHQELDALRVMQWVAERGYGSIPLHVVLDETSIPKKGQNSVGVAHQYLGCLGKVHNGQVAVTLHGTWDNDDLPLTSQLYLPKDWAEDADRRKQAKVPEEITFQTKSEIAYALLGRVRAWGLSVAMVHGDAGFSDLPLMSKLDDEKLAFCLGVRRNFTVRLPGEASPPVPPSAPYSGRGRPRRPRIPERPLHSVEEMRQAVPSKHWARVAYRESVDGKSLEREFAALRVQPATREACRPEAWLLLERPLEQESDDFKYYILTASEGASVQQLAGLAHVRPRIERNSYENAKQEVGLGDYQGRSWPGFHHHLAMVWLALTWLTRLRQPLLPRTPPPDIPPGPHTSETLGNVEPSPPTSTGGSSDVLDFCATLVPVCYAPLATTVAQPLPRQAWESIQSVRRRFTDVVRILVHNELTILKSLLPVPPLMLGLVSP